VQKFSEDISKSVLLNEFTKIMTFRTYHVIEAKKRHIIVGSVLMNFNGTLEQTQPYHLSATLLSVFRLQTSLT
jgi:hypothetical protein